MARGLGPDRERLVILLQEIERLLDLWVMQVTSGRTTTHEDSLRLQAAWRDVHRRVRLLKYWARRDDAATAALDRVGLAGAQLELKYQGFMQAYSAYMGTVDFTHTLRTSSIRWTKTILASLADAHPDWVSPREFLAVLEVMLGGAAP